VLVLLSIFIFPYFLFAEATTASVLPGGNTDSETPHMNKPKRQTCSFLGCGNNTSTQYSFPKVIQQRGSDKFIDHSALLRFVHSCKSLIPMVE